MSDTRGEKPAEPGRETDERFPSGRWTGFWLQSAMAGRQYMSLHLAFASGRVSGTGSDCIGDFTIDGSYDLTTGRCQFIKAYIGQHAVDYDGVNQNDGMWIWGTWNIRSVDRGGFHIWPYGEEDPTAKQLKNRADVPAEAARKRRVLVPAIGQ